MIVVEPRRAQLGSGPIRPRIMSRLRTGVLSSIGAVGAARLVSALAAIVQLPILARAATPPEFALISAATASAMYLSLVAGDPSTLAFQRFPGSRTDLTNYQYAGARVVLWLVVGGAILASALWFTLGPSFAVAAVGWAFGLAVSRFTSTAWLMWEEYWRYSANLIVSTLGRTGVVVSFVLLGVDPLYAVGLGGVASAILALLLSPRVRLVPGAPRPWRLSMGIFLTIGSLGSTILLSADKLIMPLVVPLADAGRYGATYQTVALTAGAALSIMSTAFFPRALVRWNAGERAEVRRTVSVTVLVCVATACTMFLLLEFFGVTALGSLLGEQYVDLRMAYLIGCATCVYQVGQQVSWIHRLTTKVHLVSIASVVGASSAVALTVLLGAAHGVYGGCIGMLGGCLVYAIAMSWESEIALQVLPQVFGLVAASLVFAATERVLLKLLVAMALVCISALCVRAAPRTNKNSP